MQIRRLSRETVPLDDLLKRILGVVAALSAVATLPGGAVLVVYSIENHFFPYLLTVVSATALVFISVVVVFVYAVGLFAGMMASLSIVVIFTIFQKSHYLHRHGIRWRRAVRLASHSLSNSRAHLLLQFDRHDLWWYVALSCLGFFPIFLGALVLLTDVRMHSYAFLLLYFLIAGGSSVVALDSAPSWESAIRKRLPVLSVLLLFTLPAFSATTPLLNVWMGIMGFRSLPRLAVLVDEAAEEQIEQQSTLTIASLPRCPVSAAGRSMFYIRGGAVVWMGLGSQTLLDFGMSDLPPLQLEPHQVMLQPGSTAPPC